MNNVTATVRENYGSGMISISYNPIHPCVFLVECSRTDETKNEKTVQVEIELDEAKCLSNFISDMIRNNKSEIENEKAEENCNA